MTARARITKADLALAADLAKNDGVAVKITVPSGKTFIVTPSGRGRTLHAGI